MKYDPQKIEPKWQKFWEENNFYRAEDFSEKPKKYILIEFPYPSGAGLHVGHCRSYSALDAISRKKRMEGFNVLFPIGFDAFGLPTENYAIKTGIHPSEATERNVANYRRQLKSLGLSFDWSRQINTTDPEYYKWTQWIFLKMFEKGLAYQAEIPINWCPSCKIGLANEEVISGRCERCKTQVSQKKLKQWMLKITEYADRLVDDLQDLDYQERIKAQQKEWIGRSEGVEIDFPVEGREEKIKVFTTRADTIFGVTALVVAPEHPLLEKIVSEDHRKEVDAYVAQSRLKSEFERTKLEKEKTGVFTGSCCTNPANQERIPVWVGDYVVATYGGGAVMVVPAHDRRDYHFAKEYGLDIKEVVSGGNISREAFVEYGKLINSGRFSGLSSKEAMEEIGKFLEDKGAARKKIHYKLRDWVFSRQHYWGEPIPLIHCAKCGVVPVPEEDLPVELPFVESYKPTATGESPLADIEDWVNVKCPKCSGPARRETDTMPNWAGSNWYYLRYCDPDNGKEIIAKKKADYWMPVDWYNGGMEHTTLHLLYSRFIYKFLFDIGVVPQSEPYRKRTSHGIVLAEDGRKMSKSFGNVVNPDDIVEEYGADTLRVYEMFMGPFGQTIDWNSSGVMGVRRFLNRVWDLSLECGKKGDSSSRAKAEFHKLIKKVGEDLDNRKFNTAVAAFMEFINFCYDNPEEVGSEVVKNLIVLLAPLAPHITEELWRQLGNKNSVHLESWPRFDPKLIKEETITLIIQVNGKVRDRVTAAAGISKDEAEGLALDRKKIKQRLGDRKVRDVIFVPDKIINIVI